MKRTRISIDPAALPEPVRAWIGSAPVYDSSCSAQAQVLFLDGGGGRFLKIGRAKSLYREAQMTAYFHGKGLSTPVLGYISGDKDYLLTARIPGEDGIAPQHLADPKRLCDVYAESLRTLHGTACADCPVRGMTSGMFDEMTRVRKTGSYDADLLAYCGMRDPDEAYRLLCERRELLRDDTLIHGDCCLPNILFEEFAFTGFIDLGEAGMGERNYDLFWGVWTLQFNLHTDAYKDRFLDAYGRADVDLERMQLCGMLSALTYAGSV